MDDDGSITPDPLKGPKRNLQISNLKAFYTTVPPIFTFLSHVLCIPVQRPGLEVVCTPIPIPSLISPSHTPQLSFEPRSEQLETLDPAAKANIVIISFFDYTGTNTHHEPKGESS